MNRVGSAYYAIPHIAAPTRTREKRFRRDLEDEMGGDHSETVHRFGDGWTVKKLQTKGDAWIEGNLMANCLRDKIFTKCPSAGEGPFGARVHEKDGCPTCGQYQVHKPVMDRGKIEEPINDDEHDLNGTYSIRDPDNIPRVSFEMAKRRAIAGYDYYNVPTLRGKANKSHLKFHPDLLDRFHRFMSGKDYDLNDDGADYENPHDFLNPNHEPIFHDRHWDE